MGQPNGVHTPLSNTESIGIGREPPELKHLSRARKRPVSYTHLAAAVKRRVQALSGITGCKGSAGGKTSWK